MERPFYRDAWTKNISHLPLGGKPKLGLAPRPLDRIGMYPGVLPANKLDAVVDLPVYISMVFDFVVSTPHVADNDGA